MYNLAVNEVEERLVIITGMSGAGKSTGLRCFEDLGYCCIDNVPPMLIETFVQLYKQTPGAITNIAVVCDVRSGELFNAFRQAVEQRKEQGAQCDVLYFDCDDDVLITRFKESRRIPPLGTGKRLEDAVRLERELLTPLKELATYTLDTSDLRPNQLRERVLGLYGGDRRGVACTVTVLSFGYKYGMPSDADMVFDSRFIPNPFYLEHLRNLTGDDQEVVDYVMGHQEAVRFKQMVIDMLEYILPRYESVHKYNAIIAFGCTGGKHRSVTLANELSAELQKKGVRVFVQHRDIGKI